MNFSKQLILWYLENSRDLPWRNTKNPYYIWLSEIILQQTRVDQGMAYYFKFIERYPTVKLLAQAKEEDILKLWQGLGYYSRARNLHFTANQIITEYNGEFPTTFNQLIKLKGIGDYTASAIASICFNEATAVVDGNVYRVLARYFEIKTPINSTKGKKEFKQLAQELIDVKNPSTFNQALMELGAMVCKPKKPDCNLCPIQNGCIALSKQTITYLPVKDKKITIKKRYFNYLVVHTKTNETLIQKRKKGIWKNLYEFPLIETSNEINENDLMNHQHFNTLFQKQKLSVKLFNKTVIVHKLSHQHIYAKFWIITTANSEKHLISWNKVTNFPVPVLIDNFLKAYETK